MFKQQDFTSCVFSREPWWQANASVWQVQPEKDSSCLVSRIDCTSRMVSYSSIAQPTDGSRTSGLESIFNLHLYDLISSVDLNFWWQLIISQLTYVMYQMKFLFYLVWPTDTMFSSLKEVPRYVTEIFPAFVLIACLENGIRMLQGRPAVRVNETIGSLSQGVFQECVRIKIRSIEVLMYCLIWENFRIYTMPWDSLWTWWACYLCVDFGFYMAHRLAHEVNFIWAIHQAHHSSQEYAIVSALRQAVLQPLTAWLTYTPFALFIPPQVFLVHLQLSELYMVWIHTEVVDSLGPLELILNTPSHHRVHHSRNPEYIDKNYGGMLIIWDRLFGTFKAEDKENPPVYGLVHPVNSFNPLYIQFHPWPVIWRRMKRAKSLRHKLGVLLMGPGWRPGLQRLGDPKELPKIVYPIEFYDPPIRMWRKAYIVVHFALLILFYHELTLFQTSFSPLTVNFGILNLLATITTLGLMLDHKHPFSSVYELVRCLMYFQVRQYIGPIIDHGLRRTDVPHQVRMLMVLAIDGWFVLSSIANSIDLVANFVKSRFKPAGEKVQAFHSIAN